MRTVPNKKGSIPAQRLRRNHSLQISLDHLENQKALSFFSWFLIVRPEFLRPHLDQFPFFGAALFTGCPVLGVASVKLPALMTLCR